MVARKTSIPLALLAGAALAVPGGAQAAGPAAHSAGSGAPAVNPSVIGTPILRTDASLGAAADFIDVGDGASAAKPLTAARRYLIRSYTGAKYLIANVPPAPATEGAANPAASFAKRARQVVRSSHRGRRSLSRYLQAHASDDGPAGPAFADSPTAVFNVLTSQYGAATAAIGMYPDTTGALQDKVELVLDTAIILRNRLVKAVAAAEPPAPPAQEGRVRASASDAVVAPYAAVMPGLTVLIDDEIQSLKALRPTLPAAAQGGIDAALAADGKVKALVDVTWPPAPAD